MIKQGMEIQKQVITYLNPGKTPFITFDLPLFALAKFVQWKWPVTHSKTVHVVMLDVLHSETTLWNTLGDLLDETDWTAALMEAEAPHSNQA